MIYLRFCAPSRQRGKKQAEKTLISLAQIAYFYYLIYVSTFNSTPFVQRQRPLGFNPIRRRISIPLLFLFSEYMATAIEPTLQELQQKFADSDEEVERPGGVDTAPPVPHDDGTAPPASRWEQVVSDPHYYDNELREQNGADDDEEEDEEEWNSEDEELASAMEWADLRDGMFLCLFVYLHTT